jgi:hypothetical protein
MQPSTDHNGDINHDNEGAGSDSHEPTSNPLNQENNMPNMQTRSAITPVSSFATTSVATSRAEAPRTIFSSENGKAIMKRLSAYDPATNKRPDNVIGLFPGVMPESAHAVPANADHYSPLDSSLTVSAARKSLASFESSLALMGIRLIVSDEALREITLASIDPKFGAQPIQKTIQMQIEFPLSQAVLQGRFKKGDTIMVLWENGGNTFMN